MRDIQAEIRHYIAQQPGVIALAGDRVYAGVELPASYSVDDGPAILLNIRGGRPQYNDQVLEPSVQLRIYGAMEADAWALYNAFYEAMQSRMYPGMLWATCEIMGQMLRDQQTRWPYVITFFTFIVRKD